MELSAAQLDLFPAVERNAKGETVDDSMFCPPKCWGLGHGIDPQTGERWAFTSCFQFGTEPEVVGDRFRRLARCIEAEKKAIAKAAEEAAK